MTKKYILFKVFCFSFSDKFFNFTFFDEHIFEATFKLYDLLFLFWI